MFYTLSDPAPVYDCEDFTHQLDYFEQAQHRELIYFPETAWWLGFDNNVPLATPIVGITISRHYQNQKRLLGHRSCDLHNRQRMDLLDVRPLSHQGHLG